jgi:hypothetical protein
MKNAKMFTILVLALGLMVWSASVAEGRQDLTVNGADATSITLELGQSRTVEVRSTDGTSYVDYVGFDNGVVLGTFSYLETKDEAGNLATVLDYNQPAFYGYYVSAAGIAPAPSAGVHFVFEYVAQELGTAYVKLYNSTFTTEIDSVRITVIPALMGTAWTYQGRLMDSDSPADGLYDFEFKLYHAPNGGIQKGNTIDVNDLDVIEGQFTVELDFGSDVFAGDARWLETTVAQSDGSNPATLTPRVELTPTPYALYAETAGGDNDWRISGDNMYAIPSGTVEVSRAHDATGPVLKVRRSLPTIGQHTRMEIDSDSIDTYWYHIPQTSGATLGLNSNSSGNVILAGGGGNVGIGTTDPLSKLSVVGDGYFSGNVGIGTTNPQSKLSVGGDGFANTGVYGSGSTYGVYGSGPFYGVYGKGSAIGVSGEDSNTGSYGCLGYGDWGGYFNGDGYFSGNVGIGTTNPTEKLEVAGNEKVTGDLKVGGSYFDSSSDAGASGQILASTGSGTDWVSPSAVPDSDWIISGNDMYSGVSGNVGIGTTRPASKLEVDGDLKVTGAYKGDIGPNNGAPFPRPAYDSGWVTISDVEKLTHNIGGNVDEYVVDMQFKDTNPYGNGIHNYGSGGIEFDGYYLGAYWRNLTTTSISVLRWGDDLFADQVRIRIWVYN